MSGIYRIGSIVPPYEDTRYVKAGEEGDNDMWVVTIDYVLPRGEISGKANYNHEGCIEMYATSQEEVLRRAAKIVEALNG